jgi:hypothetical protein
MKVAVRWLMLALVSLTMTSCLEILETIYIKKDGSGTYTMKLTVGEGARKMMENTVDIGDDEEDDFNPVNLAGSGDMKDNFRELGESLKKIQGVSNFEIFNNETTMEFGYTFDFDEVSTLNTCMEVTAGSKLANMPAIQGKGKKKVVPTARYIEWNKNALIRHQSAELEKMKEMKNNGSSNNGVMGGLDITYVLQDMRYVCTYQFEKPVKSFSNEASSLSEDKQELILECYPFARRPIDSKEAKLQEDACSQAVTVLFK